jgi:hypothetical protein
MLHDFLRKISPPVKGRTDGCDLAAALLFQAWRTVIAFAAILFVFLVAFFAGIVSIAVTGGAARGADAGTAATGRTSAGS